MCLNDYKLGTAGITCSSMCFSINKVLFPWEEGLRHLKHASLDKGNGPPCSLRENHLHRDCKGKRQNLMHRATSCSSSFSGLKGPGDAIGTLPEQRVLRRRGTGEKTNPQVENWLWWTLNLAQLVNHSGCCEWNRFQGDEESGRTLLKKITAAKA